MLTDNEYLDKVSHILWECKKSPKYGFNFHAENELLNTDIHIEVEDIGELVFPLDKQMIQKLLNISSKVKLDIENTDEDACIIQEIKANKLCVTVNENCLISLISDVKQRLRFPENVTFQHYLHNMLIYGPGQFCNEHQRMKKQEGDVVLIIILPVPHIGGKLIIERDLHKYVFASENIEEKNAKCIAFYNDCNSFIKKMKQGYRMVLTYTLVSKCQELPILKIENLMLKNAIEEYFKSEESVSFRSSSGIFDIDLSGAKLVFLLDHSYSEHDLRWNRLKGIDNVYVSALYIVAQELKLTCYLTLAKISQTYTTCHEPEPLDFYAELYHWVDVNNKVNTLSFSECSAHIQQVCWVTDTSSSFDPEATEFKRTAKIDKIPEEDKYSQQNKRNFHGGYWDSYRGDWVEKYYDDYDDREETALYCYYRAAIVLWPNSIHVPLSFRLNYDNTLEEFFEFIKTPDQATKVIELIEKAGEWLYNFDESQTKIEILFEKFSNVGFYLDNRIFSLSMLSNFEWEILDLDIASTLLKLQDHFGIDFIIELIRKWEKPEEKNMSSCDYILRNIDATVQNFLNCGIGIDIIYLIVEVHSKALIDTHLSYGDNYIFSKNDTLSQTFKASLEISCTSVLNIIIQHVISNPEMYYVLELSELFFSLQTTIPSEQMVHLKVLQDYLTQELEKQLLSDLHSEGHWSISNELICSCEHCMQFESFLRSKTEMKKSVYNISKRQQPHIMKNFENFPLDISFDKDGKLTMTKNEKFHEDPSTLYHKLELCYKKLQKITSGL